MVHEGVFCVHLEIFTIKVFVFAVCFLTSAADTNGKQLRARREGKALERFVAMELSTVFLPPSLPSLPMS